jgi:hypothetical protein
MEDKSKGEAMKVRLLRTLSTNHVDSAQAMTADATPAPRKYRRMPMQTWKDFERRICRLFRATRLPVSASRMLGACRGAADGCSDCGRFDYQMKKRGKASVADLVAWLDEIGRWALLRGRVGVLVYNQPGDTDGESLVVVRAEDWARVLELLERGDRLAELDAALDARGISIADAIASARKE